jgi:tol-pal system protein YbgF
MAIAGIARPLRILLATAAIGGALSAGAFAAPPGMIPNPAAGAPPHAPVVLAQSADPQYRISQLEEQIRAMNGRIEELGFQMLQMQEQMRQFQEDNEFRFQSLEGGAPAGDRSSAEPPAPGGQPSDFSATQPQPELQPPSAPSGTQTGALPGVQQDVTASTTPAPGSSAPAEQTLGTMIFDEQGNLSRTIDSGTNGGNASGPAPSAGTDVAALSVDDPEALYRQAYNYVLSGDYAQAESAFADYIDIHPHGGNVADAHFWLGESQYSQGSFNEAARTFLNAHQTFPNADKAPEMLLKLGMSLAALDNRDTACATYREVLQRYPDASQSIRDKVASEQRGASC